MSCKHGWIWGVLLWTQLALALPQDDLCATGVSQSPINIDKVEEADLPPLNFRYQSGQMQVMKNKFHNYLAKTTQEDNLLLEIDTVRYPLDHIVMYNPSDHLLNQRQFPMEIHFVHNSIEGNRVVVAQWVQIGKHNPALQTLLDNFVLSARNPLQPGLKFGFDPSALLVPFRHYYRYEGSLINPPCTENTTWYVLKDKLEVGLSQVATLNQLVGKNNRAPQGLNGRIVYQQ